MGLVGILLTLHLFFVLPMLHAEYHSDCVSTTVVKESNLFVLNIHIWKFGNVSLFYKQPILSYDLLYWQHAYLICVC